MFRSRRRNKYATDARCTFCRYSLYEHSSPTGVVADFEVYSERDPSDELTRRMRDYRCLLCVNHLIVKKPISHSVFH